MKKALLLGVAWLLTVSALRAAPANANFASEGGVPFQLIFDGQPQRPAGTRGVHIDRLTPGFHWAEFLIPNGTGRVTTLRARVVLDGGLENSYVLLAGPTSGVQLRKVGAVPIRRGYSVFDPAPYGALSAPTGADSGASSGAFTGPADAAAPGRSAHLLAPPQREPGAPARLLAGLTTEAVRPVLTPYPADPQSTRREYNMAELNAGARMGKQD